MLERGDIHLGILLHAAQIEDRPFGRHEVPPVELLAVCHPSFPLKFGKTIDVRVLASYPLLLLDSGFIVRKTFDPSVGSLSSSQKSRWRAVHPRICLRSQKQGMEWRSFLLSS